MKNKEMRSLNKKWTWRKPKGKPKRPLSAYNIFFAEVRQELLRERNDLPKSSNNNHGIGFRNLAQVVAAKWRSLDPALKTPYERKASLAMENYKKEIALWESSQKQNKNDCKFLTTTEINTVPRNQNDLPSSLNDSLLYTRKVADKYSNEIVSNFDVMPLSMTHDIDFISNDESKYSVYSSPKVHYSNSYYEGRTPSELTAIRSRLPSDVASTMKNPSTLSSNVIVNRSLEQQPIDSRTTFFTPNLCCTCQANVQRYNMNTAYDDAYEPLPLQLTNDSFYNVHCPSRIVPNVLYKIENQYTRQEENVVVTNASERSVNYEEVARNVGTLRKLENQTQIIVNDILPSSDDTCSSKGDFAETINTQKLTEEYDDTDAWNANALERLLNILEADEMDILRL
jgi:hypothetical protein